MTLGCSMMDRHIGIGLLIDLLDLDYAYVAFFLGVL